VPIAIKIKETMTRASWIRRMFEQGNELKARHGAENVYDLTIGNPVMEPPPQLVENLRRLTADPPPGLHRYMPNPGYPDVRAKIATVLAKESGVALTGDHLIMTVGAACGLNIALHSLLDPGDEVLVLSPYFVEYVFYVDNHGGVVRFVETDEEFQPDLQAIEDAITERTKVLIINTPHNPTGVVYRRALLEQLATLLDDASRRIGHPIYVISDEPYRKISYGVEVPPMLSIFRNCIFCTSHSKDLALPGARIGVTAVHPEADDAGDIFTAMAFAIRTLGFVNAPGLFQRAVADLQEVTVDVDDYRRKRDLLYEGIIDAGYECVQPEGAFYLFPKTPIPDDVLFIGALMQKNILGVPGSGFGRAGHFRLAYCVEERTLRRALPGLREVLEAL